VINKFSVILLVMLTNALAEYTEWMLINDTQLPRKQITAVAVDTADNLWIGMQNLGLAYYNGSDWSFFNDSNSVLLDNGVVDIEINQNNNEVWVATQGAFIGGLVRINGTVWDTFTSRNSGIEGWGVGFMDMDSSNNLWIGVIGQLGTFEYEGGLTKFDGDTTWTVYTKANSGIQSSLIWQAEVMPDQTVWAVLSESFFGGFSGISHFDGDTTFIKYGKNSPGLLTNNVISIAHDKAGNLWMATLTDGIFKYDGDTTWTTYNKDNSGLVNNNTTYIAVDLDDNIWIGTQTGLAKFDGDTTWTTYTTLNSGLPRDDVSFIHVDFKGRKWFGTRNGLTMCDECLAVQSIELPVRNVNQKDIFRIQNQLSSKDIVFSIFKNKNARVNIFDGQGVEVGNLSGRVRLVWKTKVKSGIYIYELVVGGEVFRGKLIRIGN